MAFRSESAKVKRAIKEARKASWSSFACSIDPGTNLKEAWAKVRAVTNGPSCRLISTIKSDNKILNQSSDIANEFAKVWSSYSMDSNFSDRHIQNKNTFAVDKLKHMGNTTSLSLPITFDEFNLSLNSFKGTTPSMDKISYELVRKSPFPFQSRLIDLYNLILDKKTFPLEWKLALLVPIPKHSPNEKDIKNFRPISLIPCLSKILEKILSNRLNSFLTPLYSDIQHAYIPLRGTHTLLHLLDSTLCSNLSRRKHSSVLSLDLEKAYDRLSAPFIAQELANLGVDKNFILLIYNFLSQRTIRVRVNGFLSHSLPLQNGTPQGSPLSCCLFNITTLTLCNKLEKVRNTTSFLYADNLLIVSSGKPSSVNKNLTKALKTSLDWASSSEAIFTKNKSEMLHICRKHNCNPLPITFDSFNIPSTDQTKILGLHFSKNLKWNSHVKNLTVKLTKVNNLVKCLAAQRNGLSIGPLLQICKSLVLGTVGYCLTIYGNSPTSTLHPLQVCLNNILRSATSALRSSPVDSLLIETGFSTIPHRTRKLQLKILSRHFINPLAPLHSTLHKYLNSSSNTRYRNFSALHRCTRLIVDLNIPIPTLTSLLPIPVPPWIPLSSYCIADCEPHIKDNTPPIVYTQLHQIILSRYPNHIPLYTDASKTDDRVSYAVVKLINQNFSSILSDSLSPHTSAQVAESFAILEAIKYVQNSSSKYIIFTDSLSSVRAIRNRSNTSYIPTVIRHLLFLSNHIKICWIPGHVGIKGNEAADTFAKNLPASGHPHPTVPPSESLLRQFANKHCSSLTSSAWDNSSSFLHFHSKTPIAADYNPSLPRTKAVILLRLRLGHTLFSHGHLFTRDTPRTCNHCLGHPPLTVKHVLTSCNKLSNFFSKTPDLPTLLNPNQSNDAVIFKYLSFVNLQNSI